MSNIEPWTSSADAPPVHQPTAAAPDFAGAAAALRLLADFREEYVGMSPEWARHAVTTQVAALRAGASILCGDLAAVEGIVPPWRWDEYRSTAALFGLSLDYSQTAPSPVVTAPPAA